MGEYFENTVFVLQKMEFGTVVVTFAVDSVDVASRFFCVLRVADKWSTSNQWIVSYESGDFLGKTIKKRIFALNFFY